MADAKTPVGTEKAPSEVDRLREREKVLIDKIAKLNKSDGNHYLRNNFDLGDAKNRANLQLAEIRSAIAEAMKNV